MKPVSNAAQDGLASEDEFAQAHAELITDRSIQFELTPIELPKTSEVRREAPIVTRELPSVSAPGAIPHVFFWVIIGIAAAGLLYLIVSRLAGWQRRERTGRAATAPEWRIDEAPARTLLGDADQLAAQGLYSEAAHLLLHRSIEEIDKRRPAAVRKALTSRDIARLPAIPPSPAEAFASIVRAVERSLFGRRPLDAGDWRQCREAYERFAFAREWQV